MIPYIRYPLVNKIIYILILIIAPLIATSAPYTTISGKAPGAEGREIRLVTYNDFITQHYQVLASAEIDNFGRFSIVTELEEITFAMLQIGNYSAEIHLEPGKPYELVIDKVDFSKEANSRNQFLDNARLDYSIQNTTTNELNFQIDSLNRTFGNFIQVHYMDIVKRRKAVIDNFIDSLNNLFKDNKDPYFKKMLFYRTASAKIMVHKMNGETAYQKFFSNREIDYDHVEYMAFFNQYFKNYISLNLHKYSYDDLIELINEKASYNLLIQTIGKHKILRNEQIRELVLIKNLGELYYNRHFKKKSIITILKHISLNSKFEIHRKIAGNLIYSLTRFDKGMKAPEFTLMNLDRKDVSLGDFKGRWVYLTFFSTTCVPCLAEFKLMESQINELDPVLDVICISIDNKERYLLPFVEKYQYDWTFLYFDDDYKLINNYNIRTYPFSILIDPDGNIHTYNAKQPSEQFKDWFLFMLENEDKSTD